MEPWGEEGAILVSKTKSGSLYLKDSVQSGICSLSRRGAGQRKSSIM